MVIILSLSNSMVTFLCPIYCDVFYIFLCILYIVRYFVYCDVFYIYCYGFCVLLCGVCIVINAVVAHCISCEWWDVCGTYVLVSKPPAQAHTTHHTLLHFHMLAWYSVPDVLPSTPGVMQVYSRRYTRITLGVMQGWELHAPSYHVIFGCVTYDIHVIYMSYASLNCMSCYSFPAK